MTRYIESKTWFAIAVMLAGIIGCATAGADESAGQYIDDSILTAQVKSAFLADKQISALDINVASFKGAVQLSGFVDSQQEIDRAIQLTHAVSGVRTVSNNIILKKESSAQYLDDSIITAKVKSAFLIDRHVHGLRINVETVKGVVLLSGTADSQQEIDRAVQLAQNVATVKSVMNDIWLKQPSKLGS